MGEPHALGARGHCRGVNVSAQTRVIDATAKLNLGLEVIRRREDGFHDLATIFVAIDLVDRLTLTTVDRLTLSVDEPNLADEANLVLRALRALQEDTGCRKGVHVTLEKRIPVAAGLGGASSDAAATLLAARDLWNLTTPFQTLHAIAGRIGSDVPFFLHGGCALARGRGDRLEKLPIPGQVWFVVVAPRVTIPHKTVSLYAMLHPRDFSDGARVAAQAARLRAHLPPDPTLLQNAFVRALYALRPELAAVPAAMKKASAPWIAISGAGPAHYTIATDVNEAESIAARIRERLRERACVFVAAPAPPRVAGLQPL
jgi:4-diphosphocytidyl-2-C-methyl-D-erythritol kinase